MKKKVLWIGLGIVIFIIAVIGFYQLYQYFRIKNAKIEVVLVEDLTLEFNDQKKVSDFIVSMNGKITDDYVIDSSRLGTKSVTVHFVNDDHIKVSYEYNVEVVDTVKPVIWLGSSYRVKKGSDTDLTKKILCGDNYDSHPKCTIEGAYDLNKVGTYALTFKAEDSSGNIQTQPFQLSVYEPKQSSGGTTSEPTYTKFTDVVTQYKTSKTKIGIDVSHWQGDIDFKALKEAGVEFIMIRVGGTRGTNGEYFVDEKFLQNIKGANEVGIPVGIYFYSYANSVASAKADAEWVLKQIKGYKVDLPIAFDWEEWTNFNEYGLSFFGLTSMAEEFLKVVENHGYQGMLYSSKSYLEKIWLPTKYDIWLAHYTDKTNYQGKYKVWQMCDDGKIDGIKGAVDIDIMYE